MRRKKIDIERIKIVNIKPGDTLVVLLLESSASREDLHSMKYLLEKTYPKCKVLIMYGIREIHVTRGL